jgi:hypothetical protein
LHPISLQLGLNPIEFNKIWMKHRNMNFNQCIWIKCKDLNLTSVMLLPKGQYYKVNIILPSFFVFPLMISYSSLLFMLNSNLIKYCKYHGHEKKHMLNFLFRPMYRGRSGVVELERKK